MNESLITILREAPWLPFVYLAAMATSTALRAAWPEEEERPRFVRAILAVSDLLNLQFSGPAKAFGRAMKADVQKPGGTI